VAYARAVSDPGAGFFEYKQRVVYSLLRAAARVGLRLGLPLGQMGELMQMAYFQEARERQDLKLDAIAALFGKSLRTVSSLHHRFRTDFFVPEREVALRRALAAVVDHAPADQARLLLAFPQAEPRVLQAALDDLVREGVLVREGEQYRRNPDAHEFTSQDIQGRIDGLNRQMDILAETVWQRLISGSEQGLARTYVFHASERDWQELLEAVQLLVRDRAVAADRSAAQTGQGQRLGFTFAAALLPEDE
jgi:hypothetical protein